MSFQRTLLGVSMGGLFVVLASCGSPSTPQPGVASIEPRAVAQAPDELVLRSGYGTATVDGVMSSGEWDRAGRLDFAVNVPTWEGGGTTTLTLFSMNDNANLYVAVRIPHGSPAAGPAPWAYFRMLFDSNSDGTLGARDDVLQIFSNSGGPIFTDSFWKQDLGITFDIDDGGTNDGSGAFTVDDAYTYLEFAHPLSSEDQLHDFAISPGGAVSFSFDVSLWEPYGLSPCWTDAPHAWDCYADSLYYSWMPLELAAGFDLSVARRAWRCRRHAPTARFELWADFSTEVPQPGDIISLSLDGAQLFSERFSAFFRLGHAQTYILLKGSGMAWLDFKEGQFSVVTPKADLALFDPSNGVDVVLRIGGAQGNATIAMVRQGSRRFVYRQP